MPAGDGTGPMGMGPMTGRAAGYCAGYPVPGYMNAIPGRGGFGFGRGWGRGFGRGRGLGFGRGFGGYGAFYPGYGYPRYGHPGYGDPAYAYGSPYQGNPYSGYPYAPEMTSKQEADMLKEQAKAMQEDISSINERIKELESGAGSKDNK